MPARQSLAASRVDAKREKEACNAALYGGT